MDVEINVNAFLIVIAVLLILKMVDGFKKGMVREIISFVSLIFLCIVVALIGNGLNSYLDGEFLNVAVMIFLLALLGIVHHVLNLVFFPAKLISKLPVVHSVDKLLGIIVGILETVLIIWTIYTLVIMLDLGAIELYILQCTSESPILTWFYEHNQLAGWIQLLGVQLEEKLYQKFQKYH